MLLYYYYWSGYIDFLRIWLQGTIFTWNTTVMGEHNLSKMWRGYIDFTMLMPWGLLFISVNIAVM